MNLIGRDGDLLTTNTVPLSRIQILTFWILVIYMYNDPLNRSIVNKTFVLLPNLTFYRIVGGFLYNICHRCSMLTRDAHSPRPLLRPILGLAYDLLDENKSFCKLDVIVQHPRILSILLLKYFIKSNRELAFGIHVCYSPYSWNRIPVTLFFGCTIVTPAKRLK